MKIFLSYGHDEYEKLAQRLKRDLEENGFEIWIDKEKIRGTADWEMAIEKGISSSDWLVLLMTEHSVRRPDGVCLDEVSYARFLGKNIAPIMIQEVKPPLCIARIQWIDMKDFLIPGKAYFAEEAYQEKIGELLSILKGIQQLSFESEQQSLKTCLNPLDNDVYSETFRKDFYGRKKIRNYYEQWYASEEKILWMIGNAGIGKTAFVAALSACHEEIQAVHFCRYNDNERANPKRAIMSIAYYLTTQIPEYKKNVLELQDLSSLIEKSTNRLFEYLIIEPLRKVSHDKEKIVLVIDALDEATIDGRNELADVIAKQFSKTPPWIKLLFTSRREPLLERKFTKIKSIDFADDKVNDNLGDIRGYFEIHLGKYLPAGKKREHILEQLVVKSEGIFLYAKNIVEDILKGNLLISEVDKFPEGLTGIYFDYFERIFQYESNISYRRDVRPIMEVLCSTYMPVSKEGIEDILDIDEYDLEDIMEAICEMFPIKNGVIEPIHKSIIDWLVDSKRSGGYRVSTKKGHERLANYYIRLVKKGKINTYALKYLCRHLLMVERYDEAAKILSSKEFQNKRIKIMGLDSAIREYLYEIDELNKQDSDIAVEVMKSEIFIELFSKYRKFFYNSGLYFNLKKCGFDNVLSDKEEAWNLDAEIGIAYYYYITEDFSNAIKYASDLLREENLSKDIVAELHNLLALCYRKSVDFGKSKSHFEKAFEAGKNGSTYYDQSISLVNLGKIAYHELDWKMADEWNKKAIEYLIKELDETSDMDYRISLELFIAEYHRLSAECLIWDGQIERVNYELQEAENIYQRVSSRDRYYIRYLYTSTFRDVLIGDYENAYEDCDFLMEQATSSYDKSQILFYKALAAAKLGRKEDALMWTEEAYKYAFSIGAWLELEEIVTLAIMVSNGNSKLKEIGCSKNNVYIQNWIKHARKFINDLPERKES